MIKHNYSIRVEDGIDSMSNCNDCPILEYTTPQGRLQHRICLYVNGRLRSQTLAPAAHDRAEASQIIRLALPWLHLALVCWLASVMLEQAKRAASVLD